jgi:HEAT repeat protein
VLIKDMLRTITFRPALRRALASPRRVTRRLAFELLTKSGDDALPVLYEGLTVADLTVRLRAARELRTRLGGDALREMLGRLKLDPFMPVRREALLGFAEQLPELAPAELRAALLDRCAAMRQVAQFYLRRAGPEDVAAFYRERTRDAQGVKLRAAVAGLGETGSAGDATGLLRFLSHPEPGVRCAAVRAVRRLDGDANIDVLLAAVQDRSPGVARAARDAVAPRIQLVQPAWLETMLEARAEPHVRRAALSLVAELRWWDGAPLLIRAAGSDDEATRKLAANHIRRWGRNEGRLTARPTPSELSRLEEAVSRHGDHLEDGVRQDLLSLLAYAKRQG